MRTKSERIADTFQPMLPWVMRHLLGPLAGRLWALSMCRPTPKMEQVAMEAFSDLDPCFISAIQSSSFRRRCRKARKREMLPGLKAEAKEHKWKLLRSFLKELEDSLCSRGYRPDDTRIRKVAELETEYAVRTEELINELYSRPEVLGQTFLPSKTLGGIRSKNALPLLGGKDNYYNHLISLIYEIRREPDKMKLSSGHVSDLKKGLSEMLPPETSRLVSELKNLQIVEGASQLKILVNKLIELLNTEDKILAILPIVMRYFFIETIPSTPGDEASSHKRLPLDRQIAGQIADGQESIGSWHSTPSGRKPMYKLPTREEPLDDSERLSQFASLAGVNLDEFTAKEQERMLDLFSFFDRGNQKSSKTGISLRDYYGDRADSEKTQRQRLFQKIKRLRGHSRLIE
jgi:hypothetical protein